MPYVTLTDGTPVHYRGKANLSPEARAALVAAIEKVITEIDQAETDRRVAIARATFHGGYPRLATYLRGHHGYQLDGQDPPAHRATLEDYCLWVAELNATDLAALCGAVEPTPPRKSAPPMYTLTLRDPWGSLAAWGEKRIETRSWAPWFRAHLLAPPFPLALHISAQLAPADRALCYQDPTIHAALARHGVTFRPRPRNYADAPSYDPLGLLPAGHIVATCTLAAVERIAGPWIPVGLQIRGAPWPPFGKLQEYNLGHYAEGRFGWLLEDMQLLPEPIPVRGQLGLWHWEPPL